MRRCMSYLARHLTPRKQSSNVSFLPSWKEGKAAVLPSVKVHPNAPRARLTAMQILIPSFWGEAGDLGGGSASL